MYRDLGLKNRLAVIRNGVKNGYTPDEAAHQYNVNSNGGYNQWKIDMANKMGVDVDRDPNYNYKKFYNDNPTEAWDIVNGKTEPQTLEVYRQVQTPQNIEMYNNLDYNQYQNTLKPYFSDNYNEYKKGGKISAQAKEKYNQYLWKLAQPFYRELMNIGLSPIAAVGILGNMALESGFNKNASNGTHFGYLQNSTDIRNWIQKQYGGYDHDHQLKYMLDGLTGNLKGKKTAYGIMMGNRFNNYLNAVKDVTDPIKAAQLWEKYYEISGGQAMGARQEYAKYFYDQLNNNQLSDVQPKPEEVIKLAEPQKTEIQQIQDNNLDQNLTDLGPKPITQPLYNIQNMYNNKSLLDYNVPLQNTNDNYSNFNNDFIMLQLAHNRLRDRENLTKQLLSPQNYTDDQYK